MIRIEKLCVAVGPFHLKNVSFDVPTGQWAALMGKTGSGKTTLLETVCGLRTVVSGRIVLGDVDVTHAKPSRRNIGYVPQDGALFTTMNVRRQLAFALEIRRQSRATIRRRVDELADLLDIKSLLDRYVDGLSGGERQRVALGRALAFHPSTLCLDEPLSALDDETRKQMYALLEHVRKHTGVTALHVTHNLEEANRLADQVLRIDNGVV